MKVGDLVKLTWELNTAFTEAQPFGIVTDIAVIKMDAREDTAVTAVFGNWQTTQLEEYFEIINAPSR